MAIYKIGNQVTGIIRAYTPGSLGNDEMEYKNQPYTVLCDVDAEVSFKDISKSSATQYGMKLAYNANLIDSVQLFGVELNDKILNLMFSSAEGYTHQHEKIQADNNGQLFLSTLSSEVQDLFIFDLNNNLIKHMETYNATTPLQLTANQFYIVFYMVPGKLVYDFDQYNNLYVTLDLELKGNIDNRTTPMWLHFEKCAVSISKNLFLNGSTNTTDLTFNIINDSSSFNYITLL